MKRPTETWVLHAVGPSQRKSIRFAEAAKCCVDIKAGRRAPACFAKNYRKETTPAVATASKLVLDSAGRGVEKDLHAEFMTSNGANHAPGGDRARGLAMRRGWDTGLQNGRASAW